MSAAPSEGGCFSFGALLDPLVNSISQPGAAREEPGISPVRQERAERKANRLVPHAARKIAQRLRGTLEPARRGQYPVVVFSIHGKKSRIHWGIARASTRVVVDMRGHSAGLLKIYPKSEGMDLVKRFNAKVITVKHKEATKKFVVRSDPESLADQVFDQDRIFALAC